MAVWIGCDPGTACSFALVGQQEGWIDYADSHRTAVKVSPTKWRPVGEFMRDVLADWILFHNPVGMVIEKVTVMPGQGNASGAAFLAGAALAEGVAIGLGLRIRRLTPASWKRASGLTADKDLSRAVAARLWPDKSAWCGKKGQHDICEAALLARCGWHVPE